MKSAKKGKSKKTSPALKAKTKKKSPLRKVAHSRRETSPRDDIIKLIMEDHKPLKKLLRVLKNTKLDIEERRNAFDEFAPLLTSHSKPEEQSLYVFLKENVDLREEGFESEVEHTLADAIVEELRRMDDDDRWSAQAKILSDLVERHIKKEEDEVLPLFKRKSEVEDRVQLGQSFQRLKSEFMEQGGRGTISEQPREIYPSH